ncbi:MAG: RNA polymerase sigma factor [Acidobacteria bacterium]|nr:RNA polymerase sigma factor [Acidobacteriota bacterium]
MGERSDVSVEADRAMGESQLALVRSSDNDAAPLPLGGLQMEELVQAHSPALFRFALSIVGDRALAEDVVQEALIKAWRKGPVDDEGRVPRAWLMKVTRNTAISVLRARRDLIPGNEALPDAAGDDFTTRSAEGREAVGQLGVALSALDEDARGLILLREIDGLSYDEITDLLDIPLHTVKTRLFRARRALKTALEEWR